MKREYVKWYANHLSREMEMLVFGHAGVPVLIFPTTLNRFFEWEDRGMIEALKPGLEEGQFSLVCVDSLDRDNLYNRSINAADRFKGYEAYQRYIFDDVMPFTYSRFPGHAVTVAGASFGAYHAVNIAFKQPAFFKKVIAMGGKYGIDSFTDGVTDERIFLNNPPAFIKHTSDAHALERIRNLDIRLVTGDHDMCWDATRFFSDTLNAKNIPHTFDLWTGGYGHDWQYWKAMINKHIF